METYQPIRITKSKSISAENDLVLYFFPIFVILWIPRIISISFKFNTSLVWQSMHIYDPAYFAIGQFRCQWPRFILLKITEKNSNIRSLNQEGCHPLRLLYPSAFNWPNKKHSSYFITRVHTCKTNSENKMKIEVVTLNPNEEYPASAMRSRRAKETSCWHSLYVSPAFINIENSNTPCLVHT